MKFKVIPENDIDKPAAELASKILNWYFEEMKKNNKIRKIIMEILKR